MDDRSPLPVGERFLNPLRMKHHLRSGNQKKKTHFVGLFFLTGLWPVLRLRRSTPLAPPPPNWIALAPRPVSHARLDRRCAYPRIACFCADMDDRLPLQVGERFLNPLRMKHHLRSGNQKKKTHFVGLFFLTGLQPVLHLWRSLPSARCAFGTPSQLDCPCALPGVPLTTGSMLHLSTYSFPS